MDRTTEKRLMAYIGMSVRDLLIAAAISVTASALWGFSNARHQASVVAGILAALMTALILLAISGFMFHRRRAQANALHLQFRSQGVWELVVKDFARAVPVARDWARIGERFVFANTLITDLQDVRCLVTDTSPEEERRLMALDMGGKPVTLCFLPRRGTDAARREIVAELRRRCPRLSDS